MQEGSCQAVIAVGFTGSNGYGWFWREGFVRTISHGATVVRRGWWNASRASGVRATRFEVGIVRGLFGVFFFERKTLKTKNDTESWPVCCLCPQLNKEDSLLINNHRRRRRRRRRLYNIPTLPIPHTSLKSIIVWNGPHQQELISHQQAPDL